MGSVVCSIPACSKPESTSANVWIPSLAYPREGGGGNGMLLCLRGVEGWLLLIQRLLRYTSIDESP